MRLNSLFAGEKLDEKTKDLFFQAIMYVYIDSKRTAKEKFIPKNAESTSDDLWQFLIY